VADETATIVLIVQQRDLHRVIATLKPQFKSLVCHLWHLKQARLSFGRLTCDNNSATGIAALGKPDAKPNAAAQTDRCAQKNKKLRQNVLDGADFVRDVLDSYP
jgi:hypothetical protein